jgi:two-component system chemotaxis sensor kinase CheA
MAGDYGDLMAKLIEAFEGEAEERLQELNKATLALEQSNDSGESAELIKVIFREAHTLKGTAGGLGLKSIERLGHTMETAFGLIRSGELGTSAELFDIIYKSLDAIGELAKSAARGLPDPVDVRPLVESLNDYVGKFTGVKPEDAGGTASEPPPPAESVPESAQAEKTPEPVTEPEVRAEEPAPPELPAVAAEPAQLPADAEQTIPKKKGRPPAQIPKPRARTSKPAREPSNGERFAQAETVSIAPVPSAAAEASDSIADTPGEFASENAETEALDREILAADSVKPVEADTKPEASAPVISGTEPEVAPDAPKTQPESNTPVTSHAPAATDERKPVSAVQKPIEAVAPALQSESGSIRQDSSPKVTPAPTEKKTETAQKPQPVTPVSHPAPSAPAQAARAPEESIRVSTGKLDILMEQVAELQTARINAEQRLTEVRELLERVESWDLQWRAVRSELWRVGLINGSAGTSSTKFADFGGGMPEARSMQHLAGFLESNADNLKSSLVQLTGLVRSFDSDSRRMAQVMADLQDGVRRIRMLPISTVFETFPRLVRDTARSVEKDVNLVITGGENEVDRTILEQVKAPLVHLLRNAVDHGLESPDARVAAGKPRQGTLRLSAAQRGANLIVEVGEDGGGIPVDKVRESAVRKGLLSPEAAAAMSDQEALWLIFRPGFSTKSTVTDLSGRGVGLDVVRENVEGLGGMIDVRSEVSKGTEFTLTLPMSVATTLVMIVECGSRRFAVPVTNVLRITQVQPDKVGQLRGKSAIDFEGRPIALTRLSDALGLGDAGHSVAANEAQQALIVGSADKRYAFVVDAVVGAQEVVVKSLLPPLDRVRRVAGATILGTGEVVMVINVADLIRSSSVTGFGMAIGQGAAVASGENAVRDKKKWEPPLVLCVDDSFTTRTLVKSIVEAAGYPTKQAADGLEAWNILQSEPVKLVVTDVQMPRMDGFELTRAIRKDAKTKNLPVILVTSLDSPEERAEGVDAGADAHIVKGALRQEDLLETIKRLL